MEQKRKNILVTGGYGFIGYNFIKLMESLSDKIGTIINVDINNYAAVNKPHVTIKTLEKSIGNVTLYDLSHNDIDIVVNFAAQTHVDNSISGSSVFIQHNIVEFHKLLEVCRMYNSNKKDFRFIQISTDEVYGSVEDNQGRPFTKDSPYHPNNPYSASKASAELLLKSFIHTYNFPGIITNCSNNFGPGQHKEKMIPKVIDNYIKRKPTPIYGDGLQRRDWLYVEDHCRGIYNAMVDGKIGESYLFGTNQTVTNIELVDTIHKILVDNGVNGEGVLQYVEDRLGHDRTYQIDYTDSKKSLGWTPKGTKNNYMEYYLDKTVAWYLNNY